MGKLEAGEGMTRYVVKAKSGLVLCEDGIWRMEKFVPPVGPARARTWSFEAHALKWVKDRAPWPFRKRPDVVAVGGV